AKKSDADLPAFFVEQPCNDKPITAVIAGTAQYGDGAFLPAFFNFIYHRASGIFHQRIAGYSACYRKAVCLLHSFYVEQYRAGDTSHDYPFLCWLGISLAVRPVSGQAAV